MRFELSLNPSFEELYKTLYNRDIYKVLGIDYDNLDIMNFRQDFIYNNMDLSAISVDANANVNQKTFVQYKEDAFKPFGKLTTYNTLYNCLEEWYDTETADICVGKLLTGELFLNDASSFDVPYCWAVSLDTVVSEGYKSTQFNIKPPKRASSFCNIVIQLIAEISNQMLGAIALPDFFVLLDWFLRKEYGSVYAKNILEDIDREPEIKQLFQHLVFSFNWHFRGGHQCVDELTEVATPEGFKKYNELNIGDDIYTWNNGELKISKVQKVNIYEYDGVLHNYKSRDLEFNITPNHRVIHKAHGTRKKGLVGNWEISESKDIFNFKQPTIVPIAFEDYKKEDYPIEDNVLKLLVYILTEGHIDIQENRQTRIRLHKSARRSSKCDIEEVLKDLDLKYTRTESISNFDGIENNIKSDGYKIYHYTITGEDSKRFLELLNNTKKDVPEWFVKLSRRQSQLVINSWASTDGYVHGANTLYLQCDNDIIREKLQIVATLAGFGTKLTEGNKQNKVPTKYLVCYAKKVRSLSKKTEIYYKGKVWCPTTQDGIVMFRRDNTTFISGNSAFINLSLLDKGFLEQVFGSYMYPDFSKPDIESIKDLSMAFFKEFSKMYGTEGMFTFPVFTLGISKDDSNEFIDPEFVDWIVENNYQKSLGNNLISKPTLLASCCFGGDQLVITNNKYDGITCKPIKEVVNEAKNTNFTIFHNGSFVKGSKVKLPVGNKKVYKITTVKNSELIVTEDHLHLTSRGDIRTDELTEDDYLATSNIPLNITACNDTFGRNLTYEQGVLIGAFIGDGYRHYTEKTNSYDVNFAISEKKLHLLPLLKKALEDFGIDKEIHINESSHNVIFLKIYDETLYNIIGDYVTGNKAINKSLNVNNVLHGSIDFREGIKFGWLSTDGSNGNRIYSSSPDLIKTGQALLTSLGYISHVWTDERIGSVYFRGEEAQRTNKVQCIKFQKICSKRKEKDVFKIINNTTFIKIKSIEEVEYNDKYVYCFEMENQEEPYFTLANGIITHNCRLKNGIERMENGIQNSFGVSSVSIGSHRVCGLNLPRIMQFEPERLDEDLDCIHKILLCHRRHLSGHIKAGLLPLYSKKLLFLHKQYSTIGYLGLYEGLKNVGLDILTEEGLNVAKRVLKKLDDFAIQCAKDDIDKNVGLKTTYNVEQIPAESMAIRLAKMDKILGFNKSNAELYSNQFIPLTQECTLYDRLRIQGELDEYSSGGSILHLSHFEDKPIPKEQYKRILDMARKLGCTYFAFNYAFSKCKEGHSILGIYEDNCPICEAEMDGVYSRVVGFVTKVDKWHPVRQKEFKHRKGNKYE